jgi:hypothetical protein
MIEADFLQEGANWTSTFEVSSILNAETDAAKIYKENIDVIEAYVRHR